MSKLFYHVALASQLPSILEHGLDNTLCMEELWSNCDDFDDGVYLWDNYQSARDYKNVVLAGAETVIIEVDVAGLSLVPDLTGEQVVEHAWFAASGVVRPQHIVEVIGGPIVGKKTYD